MSAVALGALIIFWVLCLVIPLGALVRFIPAAPLLDPIALGVAFRTVEQAAWSTGWAVLLGLPLGVAFGLAGGKTLRWGRVLLAIPFGVPAIVAASAWVSLLRGTEWLYSLKAIILAHAVFNIPWVALWIADACAQVPRREIEAAKTLGAGGLSILRWVLAPRLRWPLAGAAAQTFSFCATSFVLVLVLGGGPPVETLETGIYSSLRLQGLDLEQAAAYAFWQLMIHLVPWGVLLVGAFATGRLVKKSESGIRARPPETLAFTSKTADWRSGAGRAALCVWAAIFVVPYLAVLGGSTPSLSREVLSAGAVSLQLALLAAGGALLVTVSAIFAERKYPWVSLWMAVPSGVSMLVLGLGFWMAYGQWVDPFEGSLTVMALLQVVLFSPILYRVLWPVARTGDQAHEWDAARTLGATRIQAFRWIEWPRWKRPVLAGFGMVAGASLGEVAAVSLFYHESLVPLSLLTTRWAGRYQFDEARGLASVLLILSIVTIAGVILSEQIGIGRHGRRTEG